MCSQVSMAPKGKHGYIIVYVGLLNIRSLSFRSPLVNYVIDQNIDFFFLRETELQQDEYVSLSESVPLSYTVRIPEGGGGVPVIIDSSVNQRPYDLFKSLNLVHPQFYLLFFITHLALTQSSFLNSQSF